MKKIIVLLVIIFTGISVQSQQIIKKNGKYGFTDVDGTLMQEPIYDSVYFFQNYLYYSFLKFKMPFMLLRKDGKYGYAIKPDDDDWQISEIIYDDIHVLEEGMAILSIGKEFQVMIFKMRGEYYVTGTDDRVIYGVSNLYHTNQLFDGRSFIRNGRCYAVRSKSNGKYALCHPTKYKQYGLNPIYDTIIPLWTDWERRHSDCTTYSRAIKDGEQLMLRDTTVIRRFSKNVKMINNS